MAVGKQLNASDPPASPQMLSIGTKANQNAGPFVFRWNKQSPLLGQVSERKRWHSLNTLSPSLTPEVALILSAISWSSQTLLWDSSPNITLLTLAPNRRQGCRHFPAVRNPLHAPLVPVQSITRTTWPPLPGCSQQG